MLRLLTIYHPTNGRTPSGPESRPHAVTLFLKIKHITLRRK